MNITLRKPRLASFSLALLLLTSSGVSLAQSTTPEAYIKQGIYFYDANQCGTDASVATTEAATGNLDAAKVPEPLRSAMVKAAQKYDILPGAVAGVYLTQQNGFTGFMYKYFKTKDLSVFTDISASDKSWNASLFATDSQKNGPWGTGDPAASRGPFKFGPEWEAAYHEDGNSDGTESVADFYDGVYAVAHRLADLGAKTSAGLEGVKSAAVQYSGDTALETDGRQRKFVFGDQVAYIASAVSDTSATTSTSGLPGNTSTKSGALYKSGLSAPYNVEMFITHTLKAIAQKTGKPEAQVVTQEHIVALLTFSIYEGGGIDGNSGTYNLFNTKLHDADLQAVPQGTEDQSRVGSGMAATGNSGPATYDYPTFDLGIEATARSMVQSTYQSRLVSVLTDGKSTANQFFETLTYYNRYQNNLAWAAKSDPKQGGDPVSYLANMITKVNDVRANYQKYASKALNGSSNAPAAVGTGGTGVAGTDCAAVNFRSADMPVGDGLFTTNTAIVLPGFQEALARAKKIAVLNSAAFNIACDGSVRCKQRCDHLAGQVWGYSTSGYESAKTHYQSLLAAGKIHKDRNPPAGAILFYESGENGHITTFLGDGLLISNDVNDSKSGISGGAYIVPTKAMEGDGWNLPYLGWSEPIFNGGKQSPAI